MQTLFAEPEILDRPARSSPPWVWFGFVFAGTFLISEFVVVFMELDESVTKLLFVVIVLAGGIYWLFCIHRFHKILGEMSVNRYPISPAEAVSKHFIPFYNVYWLFAWPLTLTRYLNARGHVRMVSGGVLGFLLLVSVLLRYADGAVGLALMFSVGLYISAKLRQHIKLVAGTPPEMLPPLPDPRMFHSGSSAAAAVPPVESSGTTELS
jgi:hypothetical protein